MALYFINTPQARYICSTETTAFSATLAGKKWTVAASEAISSRTGRKLWCYNYRYLLWHPSRRPLGDQDLWIIFDRKGQEVGHGAFQAEALAALDGPPPAPRDVGLK
jgi:hypothetical protein